MIESMREYDRLMALDEALDYLQISRRTIFRLIKNHELPAVRIGKVLRFRLDDLERFVSERLTTKGMLATKPFIFRSPVLNKYKKSPLKYYVHDEAFCGKVGNKEAKDKFAEVFYNKIRLADGEEAIVIQPAELKNIPPKELAHWYRFKIASI
ncbi:MAG: helix-turn-helix domain-containing protein [Planctomycetes bacterium]|nr:helix-turn-helix domain-containing protein [Planctomycetota bacterium]